MMIEFTKMHSLGNSYIFINWYKPRYRHTWGSTNLGKLAKMMSDKNFGVGSDGVIYVLPPKLALHKADVRVRIFNSDGSEAETCGNGLRCLGKYLYETGIVRKKHICVETLAGIVHLQLKVKSQGTKKGVKSVGVYLGKPRPVTKDIFKHAPGDQSKLPLMSRTKLTVAKKTFTAYILSVGNPHCVIFCDNLSNFPVGLYGRLLETHPAFPQRINVEFVQVKNPAEILMRVWERGSGETLACGSGACASALCCFLLNKVARSVRVKMPGGSVKVKILKDMNMLLEGECFKIFDGVFDH